MFAISDCYTFFSSYLLQLVVFIDDKLRFRLLCDQPICPTAALYLPSHAIGATIGTLDSCPICSIPD
ncbi:hypothetical protein CS533_11990 [Yersinia bercovieri]|uniref:Uncharacterized protein n=1 Tax=Yersinia bercovieri TaxID=634 RepID=A0A2G4U1F2_YERBE|nr:hypothetical protein CS533_11990 [Yersinia bercovieri]